MNKFLMATTGLLAASAVMLFAANVKTDYDHQTNFAKYKTYSWIKLKATDDLWRQRIEDAIDAELSAKGWNRVESGGDVSVSAFGATKNHPVTQTYYDDLGGFGWGWRGFGGGGFGTATTTSVNNPVGTLLVHMFDSQTKRMIWTGSSTESLSEKPDKNEKKLEKDTAEMFKKFPPGEKS